ncbi:MAG: GDSL-type esterase/lipase family protein, partial [Pseudomonadota bacterium]
MQDTGSNLIENGDFEDNPVTGAAGFGFFDAIPGWTATVGQLEIQEVANTNSGFGVPGNAVLELASNRNAGIEQTVTVANGAEGIYQLSLQHARRNDDGSPAEFQIIIDGVLVTTVTSTIRGEVQDFTLDLPLTAGDHTIEFLEVGGGGNGRGTLIDNVSLIATGEPLPPPPGPGTLSFDGQAGGRTVNLETGEWAVPLRFLPLGDSITYGIEVTPRDDNDVTLGGYRDDLWEAFVDQAVLIDYVGTQTAGPATLLDQSHEGISGIRADRIADNLMGQIQSLSPDVVLLMAGTNDSRQDFINSGQTTPQDIERIINIILDENPDAQIFVATLPPQDPAVPRNANALPGLAEANEGIRDLVARLNDDGASNIHLVEMSDLSLDLISDVGPDNLNDNGLHPTSEGYAELARRWFEAVTDAFEELQLPIEGNANRIGSVVQNVIGSADNDYLIGDEQANALDGAAGNDIIDGGLGDDALSGGIGRDLFLVSEGAD